jgi:hypothetical protein
MMAIWEWFRDVINNAEVVQLILFLLRFLVAAESPGRLKHYDWLYSYFPLPSLIYLKKTQSN